MSNYALGLPGDAAHLASSSSFSHFWFRQERDDKEEQKEAEDVAQDAHDSGARRNEIVEVEIVVKEAKIDPARLVQSLASSAPTTKLADGCRSRRRSRPRPAAAVSGGSNAVGDDHEDDDDAAAKITPQEESTEFELSIAYNGRTYTAFRSLTSILRLRRDLVSEVERARGGGKGGIRCATTVPGEKSAGDTANRPAVSIPEVPRMMMDDDGMSNGTFAASASSERGGRGNSVGVVGRGFAFMQAVIRSYTPALEGWLRHVTTLVPPKDSPSLTRFLWEPLGRHCGNIATPSSLSQLPLPSMIKSLSSSAARSGSAASLQQHLDSIEECDGE